MTRLSTEDLKMERRSVRFFVIFVACLAAFAMFYVIIRDDSSLVPFLSFNASVACSTMRLFGAGVEADGVFLHSNGQLFEIIAECTSLVPTGILVSAVLAWKSSVKEKVIGITLGSTALFVINIGRIVSLVYIASSFPGFLDIAHFFLWQLLLILVTIGLWFLWVSKIVSTHQPAGGAD